MPTSLARQILLYGGLLNDLREGGAEADDDRSAHGGQHEQPFSAGR
jgi:hypothetical protein